MVERWTEERLYMYDVLDPNSPEIRHIRELYAELDRLKSQEMRDVTEEEVYDEKLFLCDDCSLTKETCEEDCHEGKVITTTDGTQYVVSLLVKMNKI